MKKKLLIIPALLPLIATPIVGITSCSHNHEWQNIVNKDCFAGRATYTHGTKYFKSCSCGQKSQETFYDNDVLTYKLDPNIEVKNADGMVKVVGTDLIKVVIEDGETFKKYNFVYDTYNLKNERIRLSAAIVVPFLNDEPNIKGFVIDHHPTITDKNEAPTKMWTQMTLNVAARCAVLQCDLIGLGETVNEVDDYHCGHLSNRNVMDGILAAQQILLKEFNVDIAKLKMFNVGYSQGGYDSLSFLRYMEQEATDEEKSVVHIEQSYCGSGAYDIQIQFDDCLADEGFQYIEYILMGVMATHEFHPSSYGNLTVDDYLTENGKELHEVLNQKDDIALNMWKKTHSIKPHDIFVAPYLDDKDSEYSKSVARAAAVENLLDGKWKPEGKVWLFYPTNDDMVSTRCSKKAIEMFKDLPNFEYVEDTISADHRSAGTMFYVATLLDIINPELN